jgi:glucose 1-dehydrogenase
MRRVDMTEAGRAAAGRPLEGQWAVITGASKGIGRGIAESFVDAGASVVLVARGTEALEAAADELAGRGTGGQRVMALTADTSDPASIEDLFARIEAEIPSLNICVANAGTGRLIPFLELSLEEWNEIVALNLTGTFLCCQRAARLMVDGPPGANRAIVVVSSIRALGARPGLTPYASTKAAVNQLVRIAAYELAPLGVRVNSLSPGITATPLALDNNPDVFAERIKDVPTGRAGTPQDMAAGALYLCSPSAAFVTGTNLVIDGGESLW